jgi:dUTPase
MYIDIYRAPHCPGNAFNKPGAPTDAGYDLALADDALVPPLSQVPRDLAKVVEVDTVSPITLETIGYKDGQLPKDSPFTIKDGAIWQYRYKPPLFRTGVHVLPRDISSIWFAVALRSSSGGYTGLRLHNSIGVIDATYPGEILLGLYSAYEVPILIPRGERVAQLIPMYLPNVVPVMTSDRAVLIDRGHRGGYGSTGRNDVGEQGTVVQNPSEWGMSGAQVIASFER